MIEYIVRLREELDREREERNYFQLERDKIHTFWEITERQLVEVKTELKILDKDMNEDEGRHQAEIKVYKQKMKHLLCEHQNTISELKADGLVSSEAVQKEQNQLETELRNNMRDIMVDMQELDIENLVEELELKHKEEMTETRNNLEEQFTEIKAKYEIKMKLQQQELDNMRKNEISAREDYWNEHINGLIEDHNKALSDAKVLTDCIHQDMDVSIALKELIKEMKAKEAEEEKKLKSVMEDNKSFTERLLKVKKEMAETEKKIKNYVGRKDNNLKLKEKELKDKKLDYETLEEKFSKLQLERDELYNTYTENIQKVQDKAGLKSMQLEKKLGALTGSLEKTQAQLCSVLSASNMDQTALSGLTSKVTEELESCNNTIKNLEYKKAQISKARNDLLLTYEGKLRALGVPVEELDAKPFESSPAGKSPGQDLDPDIATK
nr:growth arrest-specific protein 8-like isoform X2 [Monopterus albus]